MTTVNLVAVGMQGPAGPPGPAGSGGGSATYFFQINTVGPFADLGSAAGLSLVGGDSVTGALIANLVAPACAYPPGEIVGDVQVSLAGIPASYDSFDFSVVLIVSSLDGTNSIIVGANTSIAPDAGSGEITMGDFTVGGQSGSDLTWDPSAGVSTTAGGVYGIVATLTAGWD